MASFAPSIIKACPNLFSELIAELVPSAKVFFLPASNMLQLFLFSRNLLWTNMLL